ncbi:hypothetical protein LIER_13582 [Lithospermum erythrorhizon]|uniref:Uncharacterized protein n=1 Tax=Lithospermum erythrorhizon TaxID=34254 RepID=A0AAV3PXH2_LITER
MATKLVNTIPMVYEAKKHAFGSAPINVDKHTVGSSDVSLVTRLSGMQCQNLLNLLGNFETVYTNRLTGKFLTISWIIDNDASNHVTGHISVLTHIIDLPPYPIGLPIDLLNEKFPYAIKSGRVQLSSGFILNDILYLYDLDSHVYFVSRDVVFYENKFPYASSDIVVTSKHSSIMPVIVDCASEYTESDSGGDVVEVIEPTNGIAGPPVEPLAEQSVPMSFVE